MAPSGKKYKANIMRNIFIGSLISPNHSHTYSKYFFYIILCNLFHCMFYLKETGGQMQKFRINTCVN